MKIISGSTCKALARIISYNTALEYTDSNTQHFADGELRVSISGDIAGQDIFILQSVSTPVHSRLMELLLLADACRRARARQITALLTYAAYGRQDKMYDTNGPIAAQLVSNIMEAAGIERVAILDFHASNIKTFFNIEAYNLNSAGLFKEYVNIDDDSVVVAPDFGSIERAKIFANIFNVQDTAMLEKVRDHNNKCLIKSLVGNVHNKNCIIVDDIIDSGNTICAVAELLKKHGAKKIMACATHAILSGDALENISSSPIIDKVFVTDSINNASLLANDKFHVISSAPVFIDFLNNTK